jgi:hypothetical protein
MELPKYVIDFEKRNAIKSQVLADFVAKGEVPEAPWVVYCDGAWGQQEPEQQPYSFHLR